MKNVTIYTDGACDPNPGIGGWAAILIWGKNQKEITGGERDSTNNRMEIMAAIEGLLLLPPDSRVQVFTTSDYLYQGMTRWVGGWRQAGWLKKDGQPVANADLWRGLVELAAKFQVEWVNAKGQRLEGLERAAQVMEVA